MFDQRFQKIDQDFNNFLINTQSKLKTNTTEDPRTSKNRMLLTKPTDVRLVELNRNIEGLEQVVAKMKEKETKEQDDVKLKSFVFFF
jgi:hypothetical protein